MLPLTFGGNIMIFFSADHHFNHENIIKLSNRPYNSVEQMNKALVELWNSVVTPNDIIFYLGDFGFGKKESLEEICKKLNGHKFLIIGNHDKRHSYSALRTIGFEEVYDKMQLDKFLFTHKPVITLDKGIINIHGHIHNANTSTISGYKTKNHLCVSVECTNYKPISMDFLKKKYKNR